MPRTLGDPLPPEPLQTPDIDDDFSSEILGEVWVPHYLPHWTTPARSAARVRSVPDGLELRIEEDQPDWRPEDAPLRVSNLQTATYSGGLGSRAGTHRHRPDGLEVRTPTPLSLRYAPTAGRIDVTLSASTDPDCMTAIWLVGIEHDGPRDSGEICVAEIDADAIGDITHVRCGIKAHHDDRLRTDMITTSVPHDAGRPLTWTVEWGGGVTIIGLEGRVVAEFDQAPAYPQMLLIDVFEMSPGCGTYPKAATVHHVKAWSMHPIEWERLACHRCGQHARRLVDHTLTHDMDLDVRHTEPTNLLRGRVDLGGDVRPLEVGESSTDSGERSGPGDERLQRADGTGGDDVEDAPLRPLFGAETLHSDVLEPEVRNLLAEPDRASLHGLDQRELHVRARDRKDETGEPGSGPHVRHTSCEERRSHRAVEDVSGPESGHLERPDEPSLLAVSGESTREPTCEIDAVTEHRDSGIRFRFEFVVHVGGSAATQHGVPVSALTERLGRVPAVCRDVVHELALVARHGRQ